MKLSGALGRLGLLALLALALPVPATAGADAIKVATTTSTENSGLLGEILPDFEEVSGLEVHVIAVGTGKALRMARDGDVDGVLVHAPPAEKAFVAEGYGTNRRRVMHNDFVIVGPGGDPAGIRGMKDVEVALDRIASSASLFISRGDNSGTHKKERSLWRAADIRPGGPWYREAGQGMGKVLQMAGEMGAYTLTDRGTWIAYRSDLPLEILAEGDTKMHNPYGVIAVDPARYPDTRYRPFMRLIAWLTSVPGQEAISSYRVDGKQLFTPDAVPPGEE